MIECVSAQEVKVTEEKLIALEDKFYVNDAGELIIRDGRVPWTPEVSQLYNPRNGLDLCHVISWQAIDTVIAGLNDARNHFDLNVKKSVIKCLATALHSGVVMTYIDKQNAAVVMGDSYFNQLIQEVDSWTKDPTHNEWTKIYNWLNSQTYNIRLGAASWNRGLKQYCDPRGWWHFDQYGNEDRNGGQYFPKFPRPKAKGVANSYQLTQADTQQQSSFMRIVSVLPALSSDFWEPKRNHQEIYYIRPDDVAETHADEVIWSSNNQYFRLKE